MEKDISDLLANDVLAKLSLKQPIKPDLEHLRLVYAAWSSNVPFDNSHKLIELYQEKDSLTLDTEIFFERWLEHNSGGTCWPTCYALYCLLVYLGFTARFVIGSMLISDYPIGANHGTIIVDIGEQEYLVDSSMLAFEPLRIDNTEPTRTKPSIHQIFASPKDGFFEVEWNTPRRKNHRIIFRSEPEYVNVNKSFFQQRYDISANIGVFNDELYISKRGKDWIKTIKGYEFTSMDQDRQLNVVSLSVDERVEVLINDFGLSSQVINQLPC